MTRLQKLLALTGASSLTALAAVGISFLQNTSAPKTVAAEDTTDTSAPAQPVQCADTFAQTEGDLVASAASAPTADCMVVGCGGIY